MADNIIATVGIPVYNGERFIKQSVDSVLSQTFKDFELIVTDDGSTDNTLAILKSYTDSRMKVISDGQNHGISYRLNQQIALAGGEYFVRMDADDIMMPNRLECQVEFLQNHPDADVVGSSAIVIDDDNNIIGKRTVRQARTIEDLFLSIRFNHPTVAGKTAWFRKWGYSESLKGVEDYDLWMRSYSQSKFADIEEPLLYYRDPLTFKLNTYLFRLRQALRCCIRNGYYCKMGTLIKVFVKKLASAVIATFLYLIYCDKWMIARRNKALSNEEKKKYHLVKCKK